MDQAKAQEAINVILEKLAADESDEGSASMCTGWTLFASMSDVERGTHWVQLSQPGMGYAAVVGHVECAKLAVTHDWMTNVSKTEGPD